MNTNAMIVAYIIGSLGALAILVAFILTFTKVGKKSWVKWVRRGGMSVMALALLFMMTMTFLIAPIVSRT